MELTKQRKEELANLILVRSNSIAGQEFSISHQLFSSIKEKNFIRDKLAKYTEINEDLPAIGIQDIGAMLKKAKETNPALKQEMEAAVKKEVSFIDRNAKFLTIGGLAVTSVIGLNIATLSTGTGTALPPLGVTITGLMGASCVGFGIESLMNQSGEKLSNKMKVELRTLFNHELELDNNVQIKNNVNEVLNEIRNLFKKENRPKGRDTFSI